VSDVKRVIKTSSASADATAVGATLVASLGTLARAGSVAAAKSEYVVAVGALQEWLALSGLANKIKGL
jgi:hypothetical protein